MLFGNFRLVVAGAVMAVLALVAAPAARAETLNALFMAQASYSEDDVRAMTKDFEAAHPGASVNLEFVPYESLYDKIVAARGAGGSGYDVILFDAIWPPAFSTNDILVDVTERTKAFDQNAVFDGAWATVAYDNKRWGMPWILDTKYLFYNTEMLAKAGIAAPPKTWSELLAQAKTIKAKGIVEYPIVWSWAQAEAVICDYATLVSAGQGDFYENGKPVFDKGPSLAALKFMVETVKDGVTNPNSKEYLEEDVRKVFSAGQAAFALNWTYMYAKSQDPKESQVVGKVGIAPAPGIEGKAAASAVNGSMGLGVTTGSTKKDLAWTYVQYMTSQPVQNKYAQLSLPIWKSSYDDPAVSKGQENMVAAAKTAINIMLPRPQLVSYQELSTVLQAQIQKAVLGTVTPEAALAEVMKAAEQLH